MISSCDGTLSKPYPGLFKAFSEVISTAPLIDTQISFLLLSNYYILKENDLSNDFGY